MSLPCQTCSSIPDAASIDRYQDPAAHLRLADSLVDLGAPWSTGRLTWLQTCPTCHAIFRHWRDESSPSPMDPGWDREGLERLSASDALADIRTALLLGDLFQDPSVLLRAAARCGADDTPMPPVATLREQVAPEPPKPKPGASAAEIALAMFAWEQANDPEEAAWQLSRLGPDASSATAALTRLLADSRRRVACQAARALSAIGPAAIPALTDALGSDTSTRRTAKLAALALGWMGRDAVAATPALTAAAADHPDVWVRKAAVWSSGQVDAR